jgi:hypothetical protein
LTNERMIKNRNFSQLAWAIFYFFPLLPILEMKSDLPLY